MGLRRCSVFALLTLSSLAAFAAAPASAQVTVFEPPDLSNTVASPTPITLGVGLNSVSGAVATPSNRQDNFTVTVPAGGSLTVVSLTLDTSGGFIGSVTFNLSEVRSSSGNFTTGLPLGPGTYYVQVITDFSVGTPWSMQFAVTDPAAGPVCGNGTLEPGEACDDNNTTACDGCSPACAVTIDGCDIAGACVAEGTASPTNGCLVCRRFLSRTAYSQRAVGSGCDDGLYCTTGDACDAAGTCSGSARDCTDAVDCTTDACDDALDACTNVPGPSCATVDAGLDAGAPDAGAILDAGGVSDAGGGDSGARADAGRLDAGVVATAPAAGSCGCRLGARTPVSWSLIVPLAVALWRASRRHRTASTSQSFSA